MSADLKGKGDKGEQDGNPAQWVLIPGQGGRRLGGPPHESKGTGKGEEYFPGQGRPHESKGTGKGKAYFPGVGKALLGKGIPKGKGKGNATTEAAGKALARAGPLFDPCTGVFTFAMYQATSKFP
jgi:hypothetical protein